MDKNPKYSKLAFIAKLAGSMSEGTKVFTPNELDYVCEFKHITTSTTPVEANSGAVFRLETTETCGYLTTDDAGDYAGKWTVDTSGETVWFVTDIGWYGPSAYISYKPTCVLFQYTVLDTVMYM